MAPNATSSTSSTSIAAKPADENSTPQPSFDDYVEKMIVTNVAQLIRRKAIASQDQEDWEQDLRVAVLDSLADFDSTKASWHTYANSVVDKTIKYALRARKTEQRNVISIESLGKNDALPVRTPDEPDAPAMAFS